jgi:hypothetical protein
MARVSRLLVLGVEVSTAGDFMVASPVTVLAGHSVWEGTQCWSLIFTGHPDSLADSDLMMRLCARAAAMTLGFGLLMTALSGIATLGATGIPDHRHFNDFDSLRSVSLIGDPLTTDSRLS